MTWAIVWKEAREQAAVVAALVVLGCGLMAGMAVLGGAESDERGVGQVAVLGGLLLALAAGVIIGSTLFAGEREAGTFAFLDRLPGSRGRVWRRKVLAGLALAAAPALAYFAAARLTGLIDGRGADSRAALVFGGATFFGFAWGAVGSVLMRTSLGACAVGLVAGVLGTAAFYALLGVAVAVLRGLLRTQLPWREIVELGPAVAVFTSLALPLVVSAFVYTVRDRERATGGFASVPTPSGDMKTLRWRLPRLGLASPGAALRGRRFAWLLARQLRVPAAWLGAAALAAGGLLLVPEALFVTAWPPLGLLFGVLVGVALFADEQSGEVGRFWAERRLGAGGLWAAKLALGVALVAALCVPLLLPSVAAAVAHGARSPQEFGQRVFRTTLFADGFPVAGLLALGPVYGLAFGQLAALLFRKAVVAAAVGVMVGGMAGALWLPSLFSGGVHAWQLWTPPLLALALSRSLAWPWATGRVASRSSLWRLAGGLAAVTLALAAGIAYRVAEVPEIAQTEDDVEFSKSLPSFDETQAGRDVRRAVAEFDARTRPLTAFRVDPSRNVAFAPPGQRAMSDVFQHLDYRGYPAARPDLDQFLADVSGGDWEKALLDASRKPAGVFVDPNETYPTTLFTSLDPFRQMAAVYAARGLQAQRDGDPAEFAARLGVLLAALRTARASGPAAAAMYADAAEGYALKALGHWLAGLRGRPDLLRRVLAALAEHERLDPSTPRRTFLAEQTILRNGVAAPGQWLPQWFERQDVAGGQSVAARARADGEATVVGFMWAVPWERERLRRAVGYENRPGADLSSPPAAYLEGAPGLWPLLDFRHRFNRSLGEWNATGRLVPLRAATLAVAVRLFEAETGALPATLGDLVPKYLPVLPADPYGSGPLNYRLSAGETITVEPPESVDLPERPDPLSQAFPADRTPAAVAAHAARALGAVGGAVVFWHDDAAQLTPDGAEAEGGWPGGRAVGSTTKRLDVPLSAAPGQPVIWSVGPDRQDGDGRVSVSRYRAATARLAGDMVYVVPLPPPAKPR